MWVYNNQIGILLHSYMTSAMCRSWSGPDTMVNYLQLSYLYSLLIKDLSISRTLKYTLHTIHQKQKGCKASL